MNNQTVILQNPLYFIYNDGCFHIELFVPAFCGAILALIGIPLNFSVCYITLKYRKIYPTLGCNTSILLSLGAFFEILHQSGHFIFFWMTISAFNFYPMKIGIIAQAHSVMGMNLGSKLLALLSLDRLLSVAAPIFYRNLNQRIYLSCHLLVLLAFNVYFFAILIPAAQKYPDWALTGNLGDLLGVPGVGPSLMYTSFFVFSTTIIAYVLVEITDERLAKIYRSLFLIVFLNFGGYFFTNVAIVLYISSILRVTPMQFSFIGQGIAIFLNIGAISNATILYLNSNEYRSAYQKEWKRWANLLKRTRTEPRVITVLPQQQQPQSSSQIRSHS